MLLLASGCAWHLTVNCRFSVLLHFVTWLKLNFLFVSKMLIRIHFICCLMEISVVPSRFVMPRQSLSARSASKRHWAARCVGQADCRFCPTSWLAAWSCDCVFCAPIFQPRRGLSVRLTLDLQYEILGLL